MMGAMTYWLNGEYRQDTAAIDIADRGFLLGDGVFETVLLADGAPSFLAAHIERLRGGAAALGFVAPTSAAEIATVITELALCNGAASGAGSARITLTRGAGARGLAPTAGAIPSLLVTAAPLAQASASPARLMISAHPRNERSIVSRWKTLNYLDNILARQEAAAVGAGDAVMLNSAGRVACASAANIFLIRDGQVTTPAIEEGAMPGIVRSIIIDAAHANGIIVNEARVEPAALSGAALFLTNSLIGLRAASLNGAPRWDAADQEIFKSLETWYQAAFNADLASQKAAT